MIVTSILGNEKDYKGSKKVIATDFEWFELGKKRIRKTAEDGTELGITVKDKLHQGDILAQTQEFIDQNLCAVDGRDGASGIRTWEPSSIFANT